MIINGNGFANYLLEDNAKSSMVTKHRVFYRGTWLKKIVNAPCLREFVLQIHLNNSLNFVA